MKVNDAKYKTIQTMAKIMYQEGNIILSLTGANKLSRTPNKENKAPTNPIPHNTVTNNGLLFSITDGDANG